MTKQTQPVSNEKRLGYLVGSILDDSFEILDILDQGGMGTVFRARQLGFDRIVALKVFHGETSVTTLKRFKSEAAILAKLNHSNITNIYSFGITNDNLIYLAMEFLTGQTVGQRIQDKGLLPIEIVLEIACQTCDALTYVHQLGVIHRDLKPSNLFITGTPDAPVHVKLIDFGIAKHFLSSQQLTQSDSLMGTPSYMSPEQGAAGPVDARTDIYSFGCVLYELCHGAPPFQAENMYAMMSKHLHEPPPTPILRGEQKISVHLESIILKCLEKNPDDRYQSFAEVKEDLLFTLTNPKALAFAASGSSLDKLKSKARSDSDKLLHRSRTRQPGSGKSPPNQKTRLYLLLCSLAAVSIFVCFIVLSNGTRRLAVKPQVQTPQAMQRRQAAFNLACQNKKFDAAMAILAEEREDSDTCIENILWLLEQTPPQEIATTLIDEVHPLIDENPARQKCYRDRLIMTQANYLLKAKDLQSAKRLMAECLSKADAPGHVIKTVDFAFELSQNHFDQDAISMVEDALKLAREEHDNMLTGQTLVSEAAILDGAGRCDEAYRKLLEAERAIHSSSSICKLIVLTNIGHTASAFGNHRGNLAELEFAQKCFREAEQIAHRLPPSNAIAIECLSVIQKELPPTDGFRKRLIEKSKQTDSAKSS